MDTITVTILEPEAEKKLEDMENQKLIQIDKPPRKNKRNRLFGSMKGLVIYMADDFNESLEDFKEYM